MWKSRDVREAFLEFFVRRDHRRLPSFSLVPAQDPTLLWVAAGMAPFKAEFAGIARPVHPRITTCQKCLRADDLDRVGHTTRHHTFFEMLGNFSFGDYFKEEAILWAWELLTNHYKLSPEKLWVSVHTMDDEAHEIWRRKVGIPQDKIVRLPDNFWGPIGSTGTCGPDSEIYFDRGPGYGCGKPDCRPGCENKRPEGEACDRYNELWNLVFTMYHKNEEGKLLELPRKNIDTGAGLERLTMVLQGTDSPFETDLFSRIMDRIPENGHAFGSLRGKAQTPSAKEITVARRIVADHARAVTFMVAEGVVPSNESRGYVVQQVLRRALGHLKRLEGQPSLTRLGLVDAVVETMGTIYPELVERKGFIADTIQREEHAFEQSLGLGLTQLAEELQSLPPGNGGKKMIPGPLLFRYHDERGVHFQLVKDIFSAAGYELDEEGFRREMEKQRQRSRASRQGVDVMSQPLQAQSNTLPPTKFLGYSRTEATVKTVALFKENQRVSRLGKGEEGLVVLDQTPFYAENGGQVGDTGKLSWDGGSAAVLDTQKDEGGMFFHHVRVESGELLDGSVEARVDFGRREEIRRHHTATHLLHAALRQVLGEHVQQAGSYVCHEYLRLDFSHPKALTENELSALEIAVNHKVLENREVQTTVTTPEEARKMGALAFFGEKYGHEVRVVAVNDFSKELCGGTHARATGDIGLFVILRESSIAKGIRRIEAKAGRAAVEYLQGLQQLKSGLAERLKADLPDLLPQVDFLMEKAQEQEKEIRRLKHDLAGLKALSLLEKKKSRNGIPYLALHVEGEKEVLRAMVDALKSEIKSGIILLASVDGGKVSLACGVTRDLMDQGFSAVEIVRAASKVVGGGGGGRADLAEAGGKDPSRTAEALQELEKIIDLKTKGRLT